LFALSFLSRWFAIPGMVIALFGLLATGTYLLGPGSRSSSSSMLSIACVALAIAFLSGIFILRSPWKRKVAQSSDN
jgi:hypothetical protein